MTQPTNIKNIIFYGITKELIWNQSKTYVMNMTFQTYKFALHYEKDAAYSERIPKIEALLEEVKGRWKVEYRLIEAHSLSPCLLYTSPSPRDRQKSRMPSSA